MNFPAIHGAFELLRQRPIRFVLSLALMWALSGAIVLSMISVGGGSAPVLWSMAATWMMTYSAASAIAGIFARRWLLYSGIGLAAYVLLCALLTALISALHKEGISELIRYPEMYAAFFLSFFFITGVAAAVRVIAKVLGL